MSEYLLINIAIIIVPLLLTFEKKLKFYTKIPSVIYSILIISTLYIIWDIIATHRGDWAFSEDHITGFRIFNLPLEEILFFITVPYSIIFIYETVAFYVPEKKINIDKYFLLIVAVLFILGAIIFNHQNYTFLVLLYCGLFIVAGIFSNFDILYSKIYWLTILTSFIPFFVVNYILTSVPIVTYNSQEIWGIRVTTIPLEDFFYSFSMISFWLLFYRIFKSRLGRAKT